MPEDSQKNSKNPPFKIAIAIFVVIVLVSPLTTYAARNFLRVLKSGDQGQDVLFVQKILNLSPVTQIATTGPGSPGNETTVFGKATRNAIIRFQNLYASDILAPAGLVQPTGMAGFMTLKKINQVSDAHDAIVKSSWGFQSFSTTTSSTTFTPSATLTATSTKVPSAPVIDSISPTVIGDGETVTISGQNFDKTDNTILLSIDDPAKFTGISSPDTKNLHAQLSIGLVSFLAKGLAHLSGKDRAYAINELIKKGKFVAGPGDGSAYINATIQIQNINGRSRPVSVLIRGITK